MQIRILGTGIVGQTLGLELIQLGHSVMLGTRDPSKPYESKTGDSDGHTLRDWLTVAGSQGGVGTIF